MCREKKYDSVTVRKGCRDIWNAFMVKGATFTEHDIPHCPNTAKKIPDKIITYQEAEKTYRNSKNKKDLYIDAYVCFYLDDHKFDMGNGVWFNSRYAAKVLSHYAGIITPDFSTNQDFPTAIKFYNTYRMRAFGYWYGNILKRNVYNNVRWGTEETYKYCYDGLPKNDILFVGTVGSGIKKLINRPIFNHGIREMVNRLSPHTILVYGSANYPIFYELASQGICIISYPSKTNEVFRKEGSYE